MQSRYVLAVVIMFSSWRGCLSQCAYPATATVTAASPGGSSAIADGGEGYFAVAVFDGTGNRLSCTHDPVTATLSTTSGTGSAAFLNPANGQQVSSMNFSGSTTVIAVGVSPSSTINNVSLVITGLNSSGAAITLTSAPFKTSVVGVVLSLQTTGTLATDNTKRDNADQLALSSYVLPVSGGYVCAIPYQVTGTVTPSNYAGTITLTRSKMRDVYLDPSNTPNSSVSGDDTSDSMLLDTTPQPNAHVYDWDSPGTGPANTDAVGVTWRYRSDFIERVAIGTFSPTTGALFVGAVYSRPSASLILYVRSSCVRTSTGASFETTFTGDNQVGLGTTNLTRNLQ